MDVPKRTTKSNSSSDLVPPSDVPRRMHSGSGGDGAFPVSDISTPMTPPQGPWHDKELHVRDTETPTPLASQSRTHPQSQRQLHLEPKSLEKRNLNRRMVIVPRDPKGVSNAARMGELTKDAVYTNDDPHVGPGGAMGLSEKFPDSQMGELTKSAVYTNDDPHVGPGGAMGLSEKFPDSDEGKCAQSNKPYTSDDDQGKQGIGSKHVNRTNRNDDKDKGSEVTTCLIKKSETDESKRAGEPAELSVATISGSLGSDESIGEAREAIDEAREAIDEAREAVDEAREAIDDGANGEMVFPVMRLSGKDVVVVVPPLHSWCGGVEKSELVI